jgi:hypothetical protein
LVAAAQVSLTCSQNLPIDPPQCITLLAGGFNVTIALAMMVVDLRNHLGMSIQVDPQVQLLDTSTPIRQIAEVGAGLGHGLLLLGTSAHKGSSRAWKRTQSVH